MRDPVVIGRVLPLASIHCGADLRLVAFNVAEGNQEGVMVSNNSTPLNAANRFTRHGHREFLTSGIVPPPSDRRHRLTIIHEQCICVIYEPIETKT